MKRTALLILASLSATPALSHEAGHIHTHDAGLTPLATAILIIALAGVVAMRGRRAEQHR